MVEVQRKFHLEEALWAWGRLEEARSEGDHLVLRLEEDRLGARGRLEGLAENRQGQRARLQEPVQR